MLALVQIGRMAAAGLAVATLSAAPGCGGKRVHVVQSLDGVDAGKRVRIEGTLSLRGSTPFTTPVLTTEGGAVALDSKVPGLLARLRNLAEMHCAIEGDVLPFVDANAPRLSATSYQLLALPDGRVPIVGVVSLEDGRCVVTTDAGVRYWIRGDLVSAVGDYAGALVWVVGDLADTNDAARPRQSTALTATGYGVIDEAPQR